MSFKAEQWRFKINPVLRITTIISGFSYFSTIQNELLMFVQVFLNVCC